MGIFQSRFIAIRPETHRRSRHRWPNAAPSAIALAAPGPKSPRTSHSSNRRSAPTAWPQKFGVEKWWEKWCIWVNYNIPLTWIVRPFGDDSPNINHDSSEGEQWGRYNLHRCIVTIWAGFDFSIFWGVKLRLRCVWFFFHIAIAGVI